MADETKPAQRNIAAGVYVSATLVKTTDLVSEKELAKLFSHDLHEDGPLENNIEVCNGIWKREPGVGWWFWRWSDADC